MTSNSHLDSLSREVGDMRKDLSKLSETISTKIEGISVRQECYEKGNIARQEFLEKGSTELKETLRDFIEQCRKQQEMQDKKHNKLLVQVASISGGITIIGGTIIGFIIKNLLR